MLFYFYKAYYRANSYFYLILTQLNGKDIMKISSSDEKYYRCLSLIYKTTWYIKKKNYILKTSKFDVFLIGKYDFFQLQLNGTKKK